GLPPLWVAGIARSVHNGVVGSVCFACSREVPRTALTPEQICPDCAALPHFERTLLLLLNRISLDLTIIQRTLATGPPPPAAQPRRPHHGLPSPSEEARDTQGPPRETEEDGASDARARARSTAGHPRDTSGILEPGSSRIPYAGPPRSATTPGLVAGARALPR